MSETKSGLDDVIAGQTAICTVGKQGHGLSYRGYNIELLCKSTSFEEVAYLLIHGKLPDRFQLEAFMQRLMNNRELPQTLKNVLEDLPADSHPMDVLRSGCSVLGCLETEQTFTEQRHIAERLFACLPAILLYWYHYSNKHRRLETKLEIADMASYFLTLLHGIPPQPSQRSALDTSLILYAEHEFNASTFAARVTAATLSDFYSCITTAIGTLKGPLHGGANEATMELISNVHDADEAEARTLKALAAHEKIMGFGHRVYKTSDPRNKIIKRISRQLATETGNDLLFEISQRVESVMWREKKIFPNLDFYSACCYYCLGIPVSLYTPVFVLSRVTGWAAHIFEQRANNRLIRPGAEYIGPDERPLPDIEHR